MNSASEAYIGILAKPTKPYKCCLNRTSLTEPEAHKATLQTRDAKTEELKSMRTCLAIDYESSTESSTRSKSELRVTRTKDVQHMQTGLTDVRQCSHTS
jgi:hypothetical protein